MAKTKHSFIVTLNAPTLVELKNKISAQKTRFKSGYLRVLIGFDWAGSAGYIARIDNSPEELQLPDGFSKENAYTEAIT